MTDPRKKKNNNQLKFVKLYLTSHNCLTVIISGNDHHSALDRIEQNRVHGAQRYPKVLIRLNDDVINNGHIGTEN